MTVTHDLATAAPPASPRSALRVGTLAGVIWLISAFGASTPETRPGSEAGAGEIRAYAQANEVTLAVNALSAVVGVVALLLLGAALARIIRARRPESVVPGYVFGVTVVAAVQLLVFAAIHCAWILQPVDQLGDAAVLTLFHTGLVAEMFGTLSRLVACSMVAMVSALALRERFLSRAVAILGLFVAAAAVVSVFGAFSASPVLVTALYVSVFGWFLWPVIVGADLGVQLVRASRPARGRDHH